MTKWKNILEAVMSEDKASLSEALKAERDVPLRIQLDIHDAYDGSLNAAQRLHDKIAQFWMVSHAFGPHRETGDWHVNLTHSFLKHKSLYQNGTSENMARAWLIAVLKTQVVEVDQSGPQKHLEK